MGFSGRVNSTRLSIRRAWIPLFNAPEIFLCPIFVANSDLERGPSDNNPKIRPSVDSGLHSGPGLGPPLGPDLGFLCLIPFDRFLRHGFLGRRLFPNKSARWAIGQAIIPPGRLAPPPRWSPRGTGPRPPPGLIRINAGRGPSNSNFLGIDDDNATGQPIKIGGLEKSFNKLVYRQWTKTLGSK